ncbi:hypothetical protein [Romeriopsis navalis]|nr:hypothetical protein [Romeriopsis navalis]
MPSQILKPGKSYSFSEYFDLPFVIDDILAELGCGIERCPIELPRQPLLVSLDNLERELQRNTKRIELANEMARREALIGPVLFEVAEMADRRINVEYAISVNERLKGYVDYYIAGNNLIVVGAKQADLVKGFTQLAVELIALDQWTKSDVPLLYGAVTTGEDWRFGCFDRQRKMIQQDNKRYLIPENLTGLVEILLGIMA